MDFQKGTISDRKERGVVMVKGQVSRWDGTVNVMVSDVKNVRSGVQIPESHDLH